MWVEKDNELYWEEECTHVDMNDIEWPYKNLKCPKCNGSGKTIEKVSIEKPPNKVDVDSQKQFDRLVERDNEYNTQLSYKKEILEALEVEDAVIADSLVIEGAEGYCTLCYANESACCDCCEKHDKAQALLKSYTYTNNQITKIK